MTNHSSGAATSGVGGTPFRIDAEQVSHAMLREAFQVYEHAMDPLVRTGALCRWGDAAWFDKGLGVEIPQWLRECRMCVGFVVRPFVIESRSWDAYIIGTIIKTHLADFLPDTIQGDDAACEMHRCETVPHATHSCSHTRTHPSI